MVSKKILSNLLKIFENSKFDDLEPIFYDGNFDETLSRIMVCHKKSPQETFSIITSLCGVNIKFDNNYVYNLKKAITEHEIHNRLIRKIKDCSHDCSQGENGKFNDGFGKEVKDKI